MLRHPVEAMKSYYLFMKNTPGGAFKKFHTIEDAIAAPGSNPAFDNVITRYMAGTSPGGPIGEEIFAQALNNLENDFSYVGFVETMGGSLAHLGSLLGIELDKFFANITPFSPEADGLDLEWLAERFATHLRFDRQIYQRAKELFAAGPRVLVR